MFKIGIGVTTYNRPECLAKWKEQIAKHTFMDNVLIHVAEDTDQDRQGVAKRKNECLRALKDCDHIFLFDDDCYPVKDGWVDFFLNNNQTEEHILFLSKTHKPKFQCGSIVPHLDCGGVFMYLTNEVIKRVGAFDEKFGMWGFEHANYSLRIQRSGLTCWEYPHIDGSENYLFAEDYSNPSHRSSVTDRQKQEYFERNFPKFKEDIKNNYIPL